MMKKHCHDREYVVFSSQKKMAPVPSAFRWTQTFRSAPIGYPILIIICSKMADLSSLCYLMAPGVCLDLRFLTQRVGFEPTHRETGLKHFECSLLDHLSTSARCAGQNDRHIALYFN